MPDSQHRSGRDTDKTVLSGLAKQCELTFRCLRFRSISADDGSLDSTAKVAKISTVNGPLTKNVPRDSGRKPATTLCGKSKVKCGFLCVFTVCVVVVVFISSVFFCFFYGQNVSASFLCLFCPALVLVLIMCASSCSVDLSK